MRLGPLGRRFAGVLAAALVLYSVQVFGTNLTHAERLQERVFRKWIGELEASGALDRCTADPATWSRPSDGSGGLFALDGGGRPQNPLAPDVQVPIERALPRTVVQVDPGPVRAVLLGLSALGGLPPSRPQWMAVYDRGLGAPCRYLLLYQEEWVGFGPLELLLLLLLRVGTVGLLVAGALWLTVGPLVARIDELSRRTRQIVEDDFRGTLPGEGRDELGALAASFNRAAEAARERLALLERRDAVTKEVLADVAHDVRTPLAALELGVGQLLEEAPDAEAGPVVRAELAHLAGLIGNLMTLVQLEGSSIPLVRAPVDAGSLVERVVTRCALLGASRGVEVHSAVPDEPLLVDADPLALEQALGNLAHNAVVFAEHNVAVVCFSAGADVVFEVRDDGPGLVQEEIRDLSRRAFRGSGARGRAGHGLGLAIAQEVARRHGGELQLGGAGEGGTLVTLRLPLRSA